MQYLNLSLLVGITVITCYLAEVDADGRQVHTGTLSLSNGEWKVISLPTDFVPINMSLPSTDAHFVVIEAHSQGEDLMLSPVPLKTLESVRGDNIALIQFIQGHAKNAFFIVTALNHSVRAMISASVYKRYDPIPGGCCITCSQESDPNLHVSYDALRTYIRYPRGNIYDKNSPCDGKPFADFRLDYHLYIYFIEEGSYKKHELFHHLWKMSGVENIKKYGTKVGTADKETLKFSTMTLPQQGVIFNVILEDPEKATSSAYSPQVTYGCHFDSVEEKCLDKKSTLFLGYSIAGGILGLIMCFGGLKLFKFQLFLSGMTTFWLVLFICFSRLTDLSLRDRMLISTGCGFLGGIGLLALWLKTELVHLCVVNNGILLGVLLAAVLYYSPAGNGTTWQNDMVFFLTFLCITFGVPIFFIFFPKLLSITSSAIIGAYAVIVAVNYFVPSTMIYIVKCFILRMSVKDYKDVFLQKPFQRNDKILSSFWILLALSGALVQYFVTRKGDVFKQRRIGVNGSERPRKVPYWRRWARREPERTPLLVDASIQGSYNSTQQRLPTENVNVNGEESNSWGVEVKRVNSNSRWKPNRPNVV